MAKPGLKRGVIYSWFVYIFFALPGREKEVINHYTAGRVILNYAGDYLGYLTITSYFFLSIAFLFTLILSYQEIKNRHQINTAKILYVVPILLLYSIFFYLLVVGFIVFAFSNALEYVAFVNIFVNSKYKKKPESRSALAMASKKQWFYSPLFSLGIVAICLLGVKLNKNAFEIYVVGSSLLHFIYDGLIWKVRRPEVGKPLDIKYAST